MTTEKISVEETYRSYNSMVTDVTTGIEKAAEVCRAMPLDEQTKTLDENRRKMRDHVFSIGIMGEFKRGKSTVINALLGQEIVPADVMPCTATLNYIRWDATPHAEVNFTDGRNQQVPVEDLSQYVTKITTESEAMAETVASSTVYYPCRFCQNGVMIIDTPGLNDTERMTEIAEQVIPSLDAIIMVVSASSPFSQSESDFVRNKIMTSDLGRVIFLVNRIDDIRPRDRERIIAHIREKIQSSVMDKMEAMYGKDSDQYREAQNKIGGIRLAAISARDALEAKLEGDMEMLEESGFPAFESELAHLLTVERGLLELIGPVNSVLNVVHQAHNIIDMRRESFSMSQQEFEISSSLKMKQIQEMRAKEQAHFREVRGRAAGMYSDLLPKVSSYYDKIRSELLHEIDQIDPEKLEDKSDAKRKEFCENLSSRLDAGMKRKLGEAADELSIEIRARIGEEVEQLQQFAAEFDQDLTGITTFSKKAGSLAEVAIEGGVWLGSAILTDSVVLGAGGAVAGWKANGLPGALVGCGASAIASYGTAMVLAAGFGVVGLPMVAIGAFVGTYAGKGAVNLVFKKQIQTKKFKAAISEIRDNIEASIQEMRSKRLLESWLKDACNDAYRKMVRDLQGKLEATLNDLESSLSQLKVDMARSEADRQNTLDTMDALEQKLQSVYEIVMPVKEKLTAALNEER